MPKNNLNFENKNCIISLNDCFFLIFENYVFISKKKIIY